MDGRRPVASKQPGGRPAAPARRASTSTAGFSGCWTSNLPRAGREIGIISDPPSGADPDGADAWPQDTLATGAQQGVPPDAFTSAGQHWGFPPLTPTGSARGGLPPSAEMLRATFRHSAGLWIDPRPRALPPVVDSGAGSGEGVT